MADSEEAPEDRASVSGESPPHNMRVVCLNLTTNFQIDVFDQALGMNLLQSDVEQIIPVILARAGFEKRQIEAGNAGQYAQTQSRWSRAHHILLTSVADDDAFAVLIRTLESGIDMVHHGECCATI